VQAFELTAFLVASIAMLARIVVEFTQRSKSCAGNGAVCIVMLVITISFNVVHWVMYSRMVDDLKWKKYKAIGADPKTRHMYLRYELFSALRKLDLQFSVILLVTGVVFFSDSEDATPGLVPNVLLFLVELVWERVGLDGIKFEDSRRMILFWALSALLPMFVVAIGIESASSSKLFQSLRTSSETATIIVFAVVAVISRILTVASSVVLFHEFGTFLWPATCAAAGAAAAHSYACCFCLVGTENYKCLLRVLEDRPTKFNNQGKQRAGVAQSRHLGDPGHDAESGTVEVINPIVNMPPGDVDTLDGAHKQRNGHGHGHYANGHGHGHNHHADGHGHGAAASAAPLRGHHDAAQSLEMVSFPPGSVGVSVPVHAVLAAQDSEAELLSERARQRLAKRLELERQQQQQQR
jgi:hypothetical protein